MVRHEFSTVNSPWERPWSVGNQRLALGRVRTYLGHAPRGVRTTLGIFPGEVRTSFGNESATIAGARACHLLLDSCMVCLGLSGPCAAI